jgi:hypothetical protein
MGRAYHPARGIVGDVSILRRLRLVFRATPGTLGDGAETDARCNANGALVTTGTGGTFPLPTPTILASGGFGVSGVLSGVPAVLTSLFGPADAIGGYIMLFDLLAVPIDGTRPDYVLQYVGETNWSFPCGSFGLPFTTGISWATSLTGGVLLTSTGTVFPTGAALT